MHRSVCVALVWGTAASAAVPGRLAAQVLSGRVVNAGNGVPVAGAPVRLLRAVAGDTSAPADTTPLASGVTAGDGVFLLTAPGPGTYRARIGNAFLTPAATFTNVDSVDMREYRLVVPKPSGCGTITAGSRRDPVVHSAATLDSIAHTGEALCEFQVEKEAAAVPGTLRANYPTDLRHHAVNGRVVVQFVVDTAGRADLRTLRVLETTDQLFVPEVRAALERARFYPAQVARRPVRQLVQLPFTFQMDDGARSYPSPTLFGPPFKPLPAATGSP